MGKPVVPTRVRTLGGDTMLVPALIDSGAHDSIIRQDVLPAGSKVERYRVPHEVHGAGKGSRMRIIGGIILEISIGKKTIRDFALVSPDLSREFVIGARTMQGWDISVRNSNGHTRVEVGHHLKDGETDRIG